MARRTFNFAAVFFMLLALLTAGLWVWSYADVVSLHFGSLDPPWAVRSDQGVVEFKAMYGPPPGGVARPGSPRPVTVRLPYVGVVALLAVVPTMWLVWRYDRIHPRRHPALCPHCGYDLRASKSRCPECGTELWPLLAAVEANTPGRAGGGRRRASR